MMPIEFTMTNKKREEVENLELQILLEDFGDKMEDFMDK